MTCLFISIYFIGFNWHVNYISMCSWSQMRNLRAFGPKTSQHHQAMRRTASRVLCHWDEHVDPRHALLSKSLDRFLMIYPLVLCYIAIETEPFRQMMYLFKWWFSMAMLDNQRVTIWMLIDVVFVNYILNDFTWSPHFPWHVLLFRLVGWDDGYPMPFISFKGVAQPEVFVVQQIRHRESQFEGFVKQVFAKLCWFICQCCLMLVGYLFCGYAQTWSIHVHNTPSILGNVIILSHSHIPMFVDTLIHAIQLRNPILVGLYPNHIQHNHKWRFYLYATWFRGIIQNMLMVVTLREQKLWQVAQIDCHRVFNHLYNHFPRTIHSIN
jgi:hypothetical protein